MQVADPDDTSQRWVEAYQEAPIRAGFLAISWITACGGNGASLDVRRFEDVVTGAKGVHTCVLITDQILAGECSLVAAQRAAGADPSALEQHCPDVFDGVWQHECWFLAAEAHAADGRANRAVTLCRLSGPFAEDCEQHLWQGDLNALVHRTGGFAAGLAGADALAARWSAVLPGPSFGERFWFRYFADGFAVRDRVDLGDCDTLPERRVAACVDAGTEWYRTELGVRLDRMAALQAFCQDPQPTSASLSRWFPSTPDLRLDTVVLERHYTLCAGASTAGAAPG